MSTWQQERKLKNVGNPADIPLITLGETIERIQALKKTASSSDPIVVELELDLIARELTLLREQGEVVAPPPKPRRRRAKPKSMQYELSEVSEDESPF
jgi:hypothetical protein